MDGNERRDIRRPDRKPERHHIRWRGPHERASESFVERAKKMSESLPPPPDVVPPGPGQTWPSPMVTEPPVAGPELPVPPFHVPSTEPSATEPALFYPERPLGLIFLGDVDIPGLGTLSERWLVRSFPLPIQEKEDCCKLTISWHTYKDSKLDKEGTKYDKTWEDNLNKAFDKIKKKFDAKKICLTFERGKNVDGTGKMYSFGPNPETKAGSWEKPNLATYAGDDGFAQATKPEIILVDTLKVWDSAQQKYVDAAGVTPWPGANVAAAEFGGQTHEETIENEIYHILGLTDSEMGAKSESSTHTVSKEMWAFLEKMCKEGTDTATKEKLSAPRLSETEKKDRETLKKYADKWRSLK